MKVFSNLVSLSVSFLRVRIMIHLFRSALVSITVSRSNILRVICAGCRVGSYRDDFLQGDVAFAEADG